MCSVESNGSNSVTGNVAIRSAGTRSRSLNSDMEAAAARRAEAQKAWCRVRIPLGLGQGRKGGDVGVAA
eukprot:6370336-Prymnesium_polylepis.1